MMTTAPDHITSTAPERIYLDLGDCAHLITANETFADFSNEVTWSEDNATSCGIPYMRADLVAPISPASGALPALPEQAATTVGIGRVYSADQMRDYALAALASRDTNLARVIEVLEQCMRWHNGDKDRDSADKPRAAAWENHRRVLEDTIRGIAALASREAVEPSPAPAGDPVALLRLAQKAIQGLICRSLPATDEVLDAHIAATKISDFFGGAALASPQVAPAGHRNLHKFLDAAACKDLILDGVDAAALYQEVFPGRNGPDTAAPAPVAPTETQLLALVVDNPGSFGGSQRAAALNRGRERYAAFLAAAPVQAAPTPAQPSEAETVLDLLGSGQWQLRRNPYSGWLTDEANQENAWSVSREAAPYCDEEGFHMWTGPTAPKALARAFKALGMQMPAPLPSEPEGENVPPALKEQQS